MVVVNDYPMDLEMNIDSGEDDLDFFDSEFMDFGKNQWKSS